MTNLIETLFVVAINNMDNKAKMSNPSYDDAVKVTGSYKGETEIGVLLTFQQLIDNSFLYADQESILKIETGNRNTLWASLEYMADNKVEELGQFKPTSKANALKQDAWSYFENTDTYYVTSQKQQPSNASSAMLDVLIG